MPIELLYEVHFLAVRKDEMSATTIDPVNNKESTKVFIPSVGETNNNIYEDISTTEIEMHQLKSDSSMQLLCITVDSKQNTCCLTDNDRLVQSANLKLEHDPARSDYTTLSDDYLDQSSIHSVRVNIPAASSPVNHHIRQHLAQNKRRCLLLTEDFQLVVIV